VTDHEIRDMGSWTDVINFDPMLLVAENTLIGERFEFRHNLTARQAVAAQRARGVSQFLDFGHNSRWGHNRRALGNIGPQAADVVMMVVRRDDVTNRLFGSYSLNRRERRLRKRIVQGAFENQDVFIKDDEHTVVRATNEVNVFSSFVYIDQ